MALRISFSENPRRQLALGGKSALDAAVHDDPHAVEIMPDSFALESFNQVGDSDIFFLAVFFYLCEILERVDAKSSVLGWGMSVVVMSNFMSSTRGAKVSRRTLSVP